MNSFTTNENKGLLWNLMIETNVFGGLPEGKFSTVKDIFEKEIAIHSQSSSSKTLTEMNKSVLLEVTRKLHPLRTINDVNQKLQQVTSIDISQQRQTQFSNNLSLRQREFNALINSDKPRTIDFSDTADDTPIGSDMKEVVSSMIARREQQLTSAIASHDKIAASKWIGREDKLPSTPTLTIGSKIAPVSTTSVASSMSKSKVSFLEESNERDESKKQIDLKDFFSQLSDEQPDRDQIIREIKEIYTDLLTGMQKLDMLIKSLE